MRFGPAARVAAGATAAIAVVYIIAAIVLNVLVSRHLNGQTDERLASRLAMAVHDPALLSQPVAQSGGRKGAGGMDLDSDAAPVFLWSVTAPTCARARARPQPYPAIRGGAS